MAVTTISAPVFIMYDEDDSTQESSRVAMQLRTYLSQQGIACIFGSYTYTPTSSANLPQHIILIYSSRPQKPASLTTEIDKVLDLVVERQVRSIVAITTPSGSLPARWASIPTYNANDYPDKNQLAEAVFREAQHAKLPYSQEEAQRALISRPAIRQPASMASFATSALIIFLCLAVLVVGGLGAWIFVHPAQPLSLSSANPTAPAYAKDSTPVSGTKKAATTTPEVVATPDPMLKDRQKEFEDTTKGPPTISGFRNDETWSRTATDNTSCRYDNTNYAVNINQTSQYVPCLAANSSFKNFAMQVTMDIKGDAGGIIFRSSNGTYYRLAVNLIYIPSVDKPAFALVFCSKGACDTNSTNLGDLLVNVNANVGKQPISLAVIAQNKNIDIYANGKFINRFTEKNETGSGQVGVYAADLNNETNVKFSNLKIWSLDK